jgi:hypothetical protein
MIPYNSHTVCLPYFQPINVKTPKNVVHRVSLTLPTPVVTLEQLPFSMESITNIQKNKDNRLIVLLRGHVRQAFYDNRLYLFLLELSKKYNLHIYIHTWSILQSDLSYRQIPVNNLVVTEEMVLAYFRDLNPFIVSLEIDDPSSAVVTGEGIVCKTACPVKAWKHMWAGVMRVVQKMNETGLYPNSTTVINTRFDLFSSPLDPQMNKQRLLEFVDTVFPSYLYTNLFFYNEPHPFNDNFYIGNVSSMTNIVTHFYLNLEDIMTRYPDVIHQEDLVYLENHRLY